MINDSLGNRMKRYENVYKHKLTPRSCLIIKIDGKAFHSYTRFANKPFSVGIVKAMSAAATLTASQMQGFQLGYIQSDEASFLLTDYNNFDTQGWFDYELNKVVSISASMFTGYFNKLTPIDGGAAVFDSRAFIIPEDDMPNYFVWRQKDWMRNSLQMLSRSVFSQSQLHGKKTPDMSRMLEEKGVRWDELDDVYKYGTFLDNKLSEYHTNWNYEDIMGIVWPSSTLEV